MIRHLSLAKSFSSHLPPMSVPPTPLTPGNRKHKVPPALPLSVFTPPTTGTADRFPFPPSPTSVTAQTVVDASVVVSSADLGQWNTEATAELRDKVSGVVLVVKADDVQQLVEKCVSDQSPSRRLELISLQDLSQRFPKFPFCPYRSPSALKMVPRSASLHRPKCQYLFLSSIRGKHQKFWGH